MFNAKLYMSENLQKYGRYNTVNSCIKRNSLDDKLLFLKEFILAKCGLLQHNFVIFF